jgi:hypothetical protein
MSKGVCVSLFPAATDAFLSFASISCLLHIHTYIMTTYRTPVLLASHGENPTHKEGKKQKENLKRIKCTFLG